MREQFLVFEASLRLCYGVGYVIMEEDRMGILRKIIDKIALEIECSRADYTPLRMFGCIRCFEMYPPSFYIRYTPEQQKEIYERDRKKLQELLDTYV